MAQTIVPRENVRLGNASLMAATKRFGETGFAKKVAFGGIFSGDGPTPEMSHILYMTCPAPFS